MRDTKNQEKSRADQERDSSSQFEYDEELKCCVCLDLVYKPVVLGCGHMSCFWCLYQSMGGVYTSYCPVCRSTFDNFPRICTLLHHAILELYPLVYIRRELQVKEEEKEMGMFSPHIENFHSGKKLLTDKKVPCASCKKLLYRPVVLNCGHVHCEECIVGTDQFCKCSVCDSLHPNRFPKKCFVLEHLIKLHLPEDYAQRKLSSLGIFIRHDSTVFRKRRELKSTVPCTAIANTRFPAWVNGDGPVVHYGKGCDQCGMLPVIGNRYHCRDCNGTSGFDLCEHCYRNFLNLPGRFDQQHNPDHEFLKITGAMISFAGLLVKSENYPLIITPYISEECRVEDGEQNGFTGPGPDDEFKSTRCSEGPADHKPRRKSF